MKQPMDDTKLTAVILQAVDSGIKATELVTQVAAHTLIDTDQYTRLVQKLIDDGEIMEIEYVLPDMPYRAKSFYLPKGAKVVVPEAARVDS